MGSKWDSNYIPLKIICVGRGLVDEHNITIGKVYETSLTFTGSDETHYYIIINDYGIEYYYPTKYFKKLSEYRECVIDEILL